MPDTHHLLKRNGVWYYRRRVPDHLIESLGKKVLQFSLGTSSKAEAKKQREIADVQWSARFEEAERNLVKSDNGSPIEGARHGEVLSEPLALRLVRDYVERGDRRFREYVRTDPPETEAEREEMAMNIGIELQSLKDRDDPYGAQRVSRVMGELLTKHRVDVSRATISEALFAELVERGIMEVDYRKLARLADDHSKGYFDPLFNPDRPAEVGFGELAEQYLALKG